MAYDFSKLKSGIKEREEWLTRELSHIRSGRATPSVLDSVAVESYGARLPIQGVASVTTEDARTIRLSPWDQANISAIEKAITTASLGLSVAVDDKGLRVTFPELTGERRELVVKLAKEKMEEARVAVRRLRDEVTRDIEAKERDGEIGEDEKFRLKTDIQKQIDAVNTRFEEAFKKKEKEILS